MKLSIYEKSKTKQLNFNKLNLKTSSKLSFIKAMFFILGSGFFQAI